MKNIESKSYKKKSVIISMTDEFSMDFVRLQSDILGKGRVDLINAVNDDILSGLISSATAYNTQADFGTLAAPNDFHVLAAMAAQVDSATFGANANSAVMSTFKKYRLGTTTDADGNFINKPSVLDNLALVGNPGMTSDQVLVIAATNRLQMVDKSLIRSGRFDIKIQVNLPPLDMKVKIFEKYIFFQRLLSFHDLITIKFIIQMEFKYT